MVVTYAWPNSCAAVSTKLNVMSSFIEILLDELEHTVPKYATPVIKNDENVDTITDDKGLSRVMSKTNNVVSDSKTELYKYK